MQNAWAACATTIGALSSSSTVYGGTMGGRLSAMCSHYQVLKDRERLRRRFGVEPPESLDEVLDHAWKHYLGPMVRRPAGLEGGREALLGQFQLIPDSGPLPKYSMFNVRSEDVLARRSFRGPWERGQRCIIPAEWIVEPNYETGSHVAWKIGRADGAPLGIAGIWNGWLPKDGPPQMSFAMLTVNADAHPFMRRFHKPGDEKRSVVVLDEAEFDRWLDCPQDLMMSMMRLPEPDVLTGEPLPPAPPRAKKKAAEGEQGHLL